MKKVLRSGQEIPLVAYGTFKVLGEQVAPCLEEALKVGYRHIDTASMYHNEKEIGDYLQQKLTKGEITREELFITSKVWPSQYRDIKQACLNSLSRLQLDSLDLYLLHWPIAFKPNQDPPVYEPSPENAQNIDRIPLHAVWKQMEELVSLGLVKNIGVSNWTIAQLHDMLSFAEIPPACNQFETHPYFKRKELVDYCNSNHIVPFGYRVIFKPPDEPRYTFKDSAMDDQMISEIAETHGKTPAQVVINWNLLRNCGCVLKSVTPARIKENFDSQSFQLTQEDTQQIDNIQKEGSFMNIYNMFGIDLFKV